MIEQSPVNLSSSDLLTRYDPNRKLESFFDFLTEENRRVNLVSRETSRDGLRRLAAESLAALDLVGETTFSSYLDIGSGGGFPAAPILLAVAAGRLTIGRSMLVERTQKRAAALRRIILNLGLKAEIIAADYPSDKAPSGHELITLRFVKLTPRLLGPILKSLSSPGTFVYYSKPEFIPDSTTVAAVVQPFTLDDAPPERFVTLFRKRD